MSRKNTLTFTHFLLDPFTQRMHHSPTDEIRQVLNTQLKFISSHSDCNWLLSVFFSVFFIVFFGVIFTTVCCRCVYVE
jgi:hypothetical protein